MLELSTRFKWILRRQWCLEKKQQNWPLLAIFANNLFCLSGQTVIHWEFCMISSGKIKSNGNLEEMTSKSKDKKLEKNNSELLQNFLKISSEQLEEIANKIRKKNSIRPRNALTELAFGNRFGNFLKLCSGLPAFFYVKKSLCKNIGPEMYTSVNRRYLALYAFKCASFLRNFWSFNNFLKSPLN